MPQQRESERENPTQGWGQLPTVTTAAPEMEEGCFGTAVCNKEHTDAAAHV